MKLFTLLCVAFAAGGMSGGALGVVWIYIQADFNLPLSALGILVTVMTIGRLLTSFSSGFFVGRFGMGWFLIAGMVLTAAGLLGFALAPGWVLLVMAGFITGVGSGAMGTGINTFAAANFSSSRTNWLHAGFGVGATLGPILVTFLVIDRGLAWQWSYVILAASRMILVVAFVVTRHEWRIGPSPNQPDEPSSVPMRDTLRLPIVWLLVTIFVVATGTELTTGQLANSLLVEGRAFDPKVAGTWVSIYWGSLTISRFMVGFVIDRIGNGLFLRLNMAGTMLGAALLWSNLSAATSFLGLVIIGFTVAPFAPIMVSDTPRRVGGLHIANTVGFQSTGAGIGMAFLPWLAGVLAERVGLEIIPPFLFVSGVLIFLLHEMILRRERRVLVSPVPTTL